MEILEEDCRVIGKNGKRIAAFVVGAVPKALRFLIAAAPDQPAITASAIPLLQNRTGRRSCAKGAATL